MRDFLHRTRFIHRNIHRHPLAAQLKKLILTLFFLLALHTLAMIHFEKLSAMDAFWLTMTSVTTVGYGDLSAHTTPGRLCTILLIYIGSIGLLAQVVGMYFEHRQIVRKKKLTGDWRWYMKDHIVFISAPQNVAKEYFLRAIPTLRQSALKESNLPVIVVTDVIDMLPEELKKMNVFHVNKSIADPKGLEDACVLDAHTIVIMASNPLDPLIDSINFELIDRLRQSGFERNIIVETVSDNNRDRLLKIGANHVVRPIRTYPELIVRSILAPGTEKVIEDLFDSVGEECVRYDVFSKAKWGELVQLFLQENFGTPLAYLGMDNKMYISPPGDKQIDSKAIFVVAREEQLQPPDYLQERLGT